MAASAAEAVANFGPMPSTTSPSSLATVMTSLAAWPENQALTESSSMCSRISTAPCHGSMPFGGTNSVVASLPRSSSATSRVGGGGEPGGANGALEP